jgi:hypothetical protein
MCVHLPNLAQPATVRQWLWIKRVPVHLANFFFAFNKRKKELEWYAAGRWYVASPWFVCSSLARHGTAGSHADPRERSQAHPYLYILAQRLFDQSHLFSSNSIAFVHTHATFYQQLVASVPVCHDATCSARGGALLCWNYYCHLLCCASYRSSSWRRRRRRRVD